MLALTPLKKLRRVCTSQQTEMTMEKNVRTIAELLVLGLCTVAFVVTLAGISADMLIPGSAGGNDFVEYWASGRLLVHHENPYAPAQLAVEERAASLPAGNPALIMPNPPWSLPLVAPLGLFGVNLGKIFWFLLSCMCLLASVRMVWIMHGSPKSPWNVLGYTFAPSLVCLLVGQVTIFLLFGLVLFLWFHRTRPFLAGAALWLCMIKPHLFVPFGLVLVVWTVYTRNYRIVAGLASALTAGSLIAIGMDRGVWRQYAAMMGAARIDRIPMPSLSVALRESVPPHNLAVQCVPVVLGCVWSLYYQRRHRKEWSWMEHGSLLVLVSVLVAPYTWLMDQAVVLPALLHALYNTRSRVMIATLALASAAIEIAALAGKPLLYSWIYLWTGPGWLVWYLLARRSFGVMNEKTHHRDKSVTEPIAGSI